MPTPSSIGADQVNTEMGIGSTTLLEASNTWVNRVAANYMEDVYTSGITATTVTVPLGTTHVTAYIWGGGGGSSRSSTNRSTGGGGSFIYARIPLNGATTFTYIVGVGGIANGGNGGLSRLTVNGIQYTAGGGTGGTLTTFGSGGTVTYPGGEGNVLAAQNGFNGSRIVGGATTLAGGNAGGQAYGGGQSIGGNNYIPGAGAPVTNNFVGAGARGEIRVLFERPPLRWDQLRWGINFPGRYLTRLGASTFNYPQYGTTSNIELTDSNIVIGNIVVTASSGISFNSNGTLTYSAGGLTFTRTWLTSGTNAEYTANFIVRSGTLAAGSSATSTDLLLNANRSWSVSCQTSSSPPSEAASIVSGILIIKDNTGVELIRRKVILTSTASLSAPF